MTIRRSFHLIVLVASTVGGLAAQQEKAPDAAQDAPPCHILAERTRQSVPWSAGADEIQFAHPATGCEPKAEGISWVSVSVVPPGSGSLTRSMKFTYDANPTSYERSGKIRLGDLDIFIVQAPGPLPNVSYSPSRLQFSVKPAQPVEETAKKITVASTEPVVVRATPGDTEWLHVKAELDGPQKVQKFVVTIDTKDLKPGDYEGKVVLRSEHTANTTEILPVVVHVESAGRNDSKPPNKK